MNVIVKNNRKSLLTIAGTRFMVGNNSLTKESYDRLMKHPLSKFEFDSGNLKVVSEISEEKAESEEQKQEIQKNELAALTLKEATLIVKDTFDFDLLTKWQSAETRKGVLSAIEDQLKSIEPEPAKDK